MSNERLFRSDAHAAETNFYRSMLAVLPGVLYQARFSRHGVGKIEYISEGTRWLFESEPAVFLNSMDAYARLVHPDDRQLMEDSVKPERIHGNRWQLVYRLLLPSGKIRWVESQASIQKLPIGESIWRGFITDITERKNAEQDLLGEQERLALAASAGQIGTWDYSPFDGSIRWNDVMYAIHGVTRENYKPGGDENLQFIVPKDRRRAIEEFARVCASKDRSYSIEVEIVRPDGEHRLTRSQAVILRDDKGRPVRVVGIEIDITDETRHREALAAARDAAEAAHRAKSEFLATMSHEIRTPMNGIIGYTTLLREATTDPEIRRHLEVVQSCGERLLGIINDVLDTAKIEAGGMTIKVEPFDLHAAIRETFDLFRPGAATKQLALACHVAPAVPRIIASDRGRICQVLTNILGNATKFTDQGSVRLDVAAEPVDDFHRIVFSVKDTGPGMAPDVTRKIFEPFYQAEGSSRRKHGGTGLGLSIARRIAQLLNGDLSAQSVPGEGSEFIFEITAAAADFVSQPGETPQLVSLRHGVNVLVVEDNPVNRNLCRLQLEKFDCVTAFATDGREAITMAGERKYDAILMDMQLPEVDGCEATRTIRSSDSLNTGTPIIAMTANAHEEDRRLCLEAGMDDYLSKPIHPDALRAKLAKWVK